MANGLPQQLLQSLVPQLGGPRQALGFIGALEQQRAAQQQNQQTELINKISIAQSEAGNIASEANALLTSFDTTNPNRAEQKVQLRGALLARARETRANPIPGINPDDFIDMANRLGGVNGFQTIQNELRQDVIRAKDISGQLTAKQREFAGFTAGLSQEDTEQARRIELGLDPRAGTSAQERIASDPTLTTAVAESEAEIKGSIAASKAAIDESTKAFNSLRPARLAIANLDEGIRLIDAGAKTGVVESLLPTVRQSSLELDNLQGRLGLDVIGNTTFGALSESELKFALNTALPKKLKGPALREWLIRKREAQTKLVGYLQEAAIFLGTPGNTIAKFLKLKREQEKTGDDVDLTTLSDEELLQLREQNP